MIQFLNNDATAFMTGDNMHMWPISAFDCPHFGINGAFEDTTNPENTLLYFGNVMLVHAMHQDGLICSSQVGSISPAYVMNQGDSLKYYIKNESDLYGNTDSYVGIVNGSLVNVKASMKNQVLDDLLAWYIGYNPITCMYTFKNVATNEYITNVSGTFKISVYPGEIQVIPSRTEFTNGGLTKSTYWMVNLGMTMQGSDYLLSSSGYNKSNTAARQRWLFLSSSEATQYDEYCSTVEVSNLDELIAKVKSSTTIDHVSKDNSININEIDNELNNFIQTIEKEKSDYTVTQAKEAEQKIIDAFVNFISKVNSQNIETPFNLSWMLKNPDFTNDGSGWNVSVTQGYGCGEFYEKTFNLYQTVNTIMPIGTYKASMQGFQRPGKASEVKTQYDGGVNGVKCYLNLTGATNVYIKNIWDGAQTTKIGLGQALAIGGLYVPVSMQAANSWFEAGYYYNDILTTLVTPSTIKVGLRSTMSDVQWWTIFDNFRLYYYGSYSQDEVTSGIIDIHKSNLVNAEKMYNIQGVQVNSSYKGIIIKDGHKFYNK